MKTLLVFLVSSVLGVTAYAQGLSFVKSSQAFAPAETFQVALADLDQDGDRDAVFSNNAFNNCTVWFNDGLGHFTNSGQALTQQGHSVGIGDLDGDKDLDLFIPCAMYGANNQWYHRPSKIYFNQGNGTFYDSGQNLGDSLESKTLVDLVDFDSDADLDAVVQHFEIPSRIYYRVYRNDGSSKFSPSGLSLPDNSSPNWADLDNDGDTDIFMKVQYQGYSTWINDGTGHFSVRWQVADASASFDERCVALADLDGDADPDAFVINRNGSPALVFFNDGTGKFSDSGQRLGSFGWSWIEAGDVDSDSDIDMVVSIFGEPVQVWLNDGEGHFTDSGLRVGGNNLYRGFGLGDIDKDGDLDMFVGIYGPGSNEIWFNDIATSIGGTGGRANAAPRGFHLFQNYPNPFNPKTAISYQLSANSLVTLRVFDLFGREFVTLVNGEKRSGNHFVTFDASGIPSGVYCYQLKAGNFTGTKKLIVLK